MTPSDKGRFCSSCSKTVVDFTVMNNDEIQEFLQLNAGQKLCGHVRKSQLDRLKITIPATVLQQSWLGHRAFLLALLITMGTTLMSCKDDLGNHQRIDEVTVVVDSLNQDNGLISDIPITGGISSPSQDPKECGTADLNDHNSDRIISDGVTLGMVAPPEPPVVGEVVTIEGIVDDKHSNTFSSYFPEEKPRFPDTPKNLNEWEASSYFNDRMKSHFKEHFQTDIVQLDSGKYRVTIGFTITVSGTITDVKVRAPHDLYKEEAKRVLNLLPVLIPATQDGIPLNIMYALPIIFEVD